MERIAVAGLSIHQTDVAGLERVRRAETDRDLRNLADALGASELVFLSTCNRVEVIYAREEGDPPGEEDLKTLADCLGDPELQCRLLLRTGREAVSHLFRVSCSLDSLVVGEDQIIAQVRSAYGRASDIGLVGTLLGPLFHHALAVGKRVRSETDLSRHAVSVVTLAVSQLTERRPGRPKVAVVGVGDMGSLLARVLTEAGLAPTFIANRTVEKARLVADDCGARAVALDAFLAGRHPVDVVFSATAAPGHVLRAEALGRLGDVTPGGAALLAIDLAVPRDVEPVEDARVEVVDLDDLRASAARNKALRAKAAVIAEQLVEDKVDVFTRRFGEQAVAPQVNELQQLGRDILDKELTGLLGGRLSHLSEADRRAVERWARSTFKRLMHHPIHALKRLAYDMNNGNGHGHEAVGDAEEASVQPESRS